MSKIFDCFKHKQPVAHPVTREVIFSETDVRKISFAGRASKIQMLGFTHVQLLVVLYDDINSTNHKSTPLHYISLQISNEKSAHFLDLKIPILDLAVKKTRELIEETCDGKTRYLKHENIDILIQDVSLDEYLKMRGFGAKIMTAHFMKGYQKIKSADIEMTKPAFENYLSRSKPTSIQLKR